MIFLIAAEVGLEKKDQPQQWICTNMNLDQHFFVALQYSLEDLSPRREKLILLT